MIYFVLKKIRSSGGVDAELEGEGNLFLGNSYCL